MLFTRGINETNYKPYYPAIFAESKKYDRSDKYLFIPTYKLIEGLQKEGFKVVGAKQGRGKTEENRRTAKHVVYLSHENLDRKNMLVGQEVPLIALVNSHGGQSAFQILTSFFRLVCSNGLMMPKNEQTAASVRHTIGMQDQVIEAAYKVMHEFPEHVRQVTEMKQITLNNDERVLMAETARNILFDEETIQLNKDKGIDLTSRLLVPRRHDDRASDLWTTFNVIQENTIKGGFKTLSQNEKGELKYTKRRAVNSVDRDIKLNQELMTLAMKMKELKTGAAL